MITLFQKGAPTAAKTRFLKIKKEDARFPVSGMYCHIVSLDNGLFGIFASNQFSGDKYHAWSFYKTYTGIDEINQEFEQIDQPL